MMHRLIYIYIYITTTTTTTTTIISYKSHLTSNKNNNRTCIMGEEIDQNGMIRYLQACTNKDEDRNRSTS